MPSLLLYVFHTRILGRVVKALDLSPSGHSPRGFEPRSMQYHFAPPPPQEAQRGTKGGS